MNNLLKFYSPEDFSAVIPSFLRNGYRCMTWAELDDAQRVVYFVQLIPIDLTPEVAKKLLAYMQAKFKRGDGKGHTNWIDGNMIAVVPPEFQFYLGQLDDYENVESGHRKIEKGFVGKLCGWDIMISNNIAQPEEGVYFPLFGIKGKTLAGGVSSDLNTQHYMPEKNFNTRYKGYGLYGVGAPRADFLGTAKIKAPLSLA